MEKNFTDPVQPHDRERKNWGCNSGGKLPTAGRQAVTALNQILPKPQPKWQGKGKE